MEGLQVVLGAGGGIGGAVVRELAARGLRVRAVSRDGRTEVPEGVEQAAADVATADGATFACEGASVVFHCAQPRYDRWADDFAPLNGAVVDGATRAGARLVFADNLYMYGPITGPITEATPQSPDSAKGRLRKVLADVLLAEHEAGRVRVTLGRASDYYGPGGRGSVAGDVLFGAAVAGKAVRWPASADRDRTFHYLPDVARALVTLAGDDRADGRAWILPSAPPLTARELVGLVAAELGRRVKLSVTSKPAMRVAGLFVPEARELPDIWYQFSAPFVTDGSAFEAAFGPFEATPHDRAVAQTVAWFRAAA
jgi:nucleoside-diphosphate-sugar epimerase